MPDWHFGYAFYTNIVGESNYQSALDKCYKDRNSYKKGNSAFVDVYLVFETDNAFDPNAVAVISDHGKIGYLSKANAIRYRHLCDGERDTLSVRCKIYGGKEMYGAWVDLDLEDLPASAKSLNKYGPTEHKPSPPTQTMAQKPVDVSTSESSSSTPKYDIKALIYIGIGVAILFLFF
ncbi:HIRAN domain-containing protein [Psychrobacter sanguinis]|uniref:HIRAN domain-containing protein n=1 Tax=Psychrobacter sanguinis TaxID=861445 RepID=UPI0019183B46|nr:HIRAN domain-containing protein [Psychrobacter sanguinis]MCC3344893.1 HIRAN domain-containing protein [Psychrobacter sanguinis]